MKRTLVLFLGLVALVAGAALIGRVAGSHRETASVAKPGTGGSAAVATRASKPARLLPLPSDFERRRASWIKQRLGDSEPAMTAERLRRMQMSRFELAALAREAAMIAMALDEAQRDDLRRILAEQQRAILLEIEKSSDRKGAQSLADIERQLVAATDAEAARRRIRDVLGDARLAELEGIEREEREKLIAERRLYRRAVPESTPNPDGGR